MLWCERDQRQEDNVPAMMIPLVNYECSEESSDDNSIGGDDIKEKMVSSPGTSSVSICNEASASSCTSDSDSEPESVVSMKLESDGPTHYDGSSDDDYSDDNIEFVGDMLAVAQESGKKEDVLIHEVITRSGRVSKRPNIPTYVDQDTCPVKRRSTPLRATNWLTSEMKKLSNDRRVTLVSDGSSVDSGICSKDDVKNDGEEVNDGVEEAKRINDFKKKVDGVLDRQHISRVALNTFGIQELSPEQEHCIRATLNGSNVMLILPTGAGKSLTFQVPAIVSGKLSVILCPLVALMRSQVDELQCTYQVKAVCICGDTKNKKDIYDMLQGSADISLLYTTPETLCNDSMLQLSLYRLAREGQICSVVFDEAHCMIVWGSTFRPKYKNVVSEVIDWNVPIVLCTATASPPVIDEFCTLFSRLKFIEIRKTIYRSNLHLRVVDSDIILPSLFKMMNELTIPETVVSPFIILLKRVMATISDKKVKGKLSKELHVFIAIHATYAESDEEKKKGDTDKKSQSDADKQSLDDADKPSQYDAEKMEK